MKRVIIIGGGYGGLRAVEKLSKNKDLKIYLIDKNRFHYFQTEAYKFLSGRQNVKDTTSDLKNFSKHFCNVEFIQDKAISINNNQIICKNGEYNFDYLILAVGAKDFIPSVFKEYSYKIKDLKSAFEFKKEYLQMIYEDVSKDKNFKVVIGGAGQSGVELAGELMCIAKECERKAHQESKIEVVLIEAQETILPGANNYMKENVCKRLKRLGVEVLTNSFIKDITKNSIILEKQEIKYDLFIFLGGIEPTNFIKNLPYQKDKRGFLIVDNHLKVDNNIFAIGDCAIIKDIKGNTLAPTAQIAEQTAEYVTKVICGKIDKEFNGKLYGTFAEIGKKYAVGHLFHKIYLKGYLAYLIKNIITKLYAYGIKIKANSGYKRNI